MTDLLNPISQLSCCDRANGKTFLYPCACPVADIAAFMHQTLTYDTGGGPFTVINDYDIGPLVGSCGHGSIGSNYDFINSIGDTPSPGPPAVTLLKDDTTCNIAFYATNLIPGQTYLFTLALQTRSATCNGVSFWFPGAPEGGPSDYDSMYGTWGPGGSVTATFTATADSQYVGFLGDLCTPDGTIALPPGAGSQYQAIGYTLEITP